MDKNNREADEHNKFQGRIKDIHSDKSNRDSEKNNEESVKNNRYLDENNK
jgi:hypothetical protein